MHKDLLRMKKRDVLNIIGSKKQVTTYKTDVKIAETRMILTERSEKLVSVLADYFNNPIAVMLFNMPIDCEKFKQALCEREFSAFLVHRNLANRVEKITFESSGELKLRLYVALTTYIEYKTGTLPQAVAVYLYDNN